MAGLLIRRNIVVIQMVARFLHIGHVETVEAFNMPFSRYFCSEQLEKLMRELTTQYNFVASLIGAVSE